MWCFFCFFGSFTLYKRKSSSLQIDYQPLSARLSQLVCSVLCVWKCEMFDITPGMHRHISAVEYLILSCEDLHLFLIHRFSKHLGDSGV